MSTNAPAARWIAATAGVCATGLVGSWLLLLGPQLEAAAATRQQATEVRTQNVALATRLAELRADFARIDEYRADLASLRSQLPGDARLSQLSREIDAAARATGVTLVRMDVTDAVDMATAAAAMPAVTPAPTDVAAAPDGAAPVDGAPADSAAAASSDAAVAVAPVAPAAPPVPGMIAIPITTTVAGSVDGVRAFLTALQTGLERQLLVTGLTVTALEESTGANGARAAAAGDVQAMVGALAYVVPSEAADEAVVEGPLPTGSGGGSFRSSTSSTGAAAPSEPAVEAAPTPDPAVEAAAAIAELEERLAAAEAAAAHSAEHAATSAAAAAAAQAAAALIPVTTEPAAAGS